MKVLLFELFVPAGVADLKWLGRDPVMWGIESILLMCSSWFGVFMYAELLYANMQVSVFRIYLFTAFIHLCLVDDELVVNPKVFLQIKLGDVVEIAHPNDEYR